MVEARVKVATVTTRTIKKAKAVTVMTKKAKVAIVTTMTKREKVVIVTAKEKAGIITPRSDRLMTTKENLEENPMVKNQVTIRKAVVVIPEVVTMENRTSIKEEADTEVASEGLPNAIAIAAKRDRLNVVVAHTTVHMVMEIRKAVTLMVTEIRKGAVIIRF